jgi:hypothetical protein
MITTYRYVSGHYRYLIWFSFAPQACASTFVLYVVITA